MFSLPIHETSDSKKSLSATLLEGVPRAYSTIFFSTSTSLGWWLLGVTMLAPDMGLTGLAAVVLAFFAGWFLGFDRDQLGNGHLLFNSLLAGNTVAWLHHSYQYSPGLFIMLAVASSLSALWLSVGMGAFFSKMLGLGAHSFPAVCVSYMLYFLGVALFGPVHMEMMARGDLLDLTMVPWMLRAVCQGFGSMLFMPLALPGLLVMIGVAVHSRLTFIAALVGFASGFSGMKLLGYDMEPMSLLWCGFNFLLCSVSLTTGYYTPSRASLMLGSIAAFLCAPMAVAVATALRYFELPASALPANLVILTMVYALQQRKEAGLLLPNLHPARGPAVSARLLLLYHARFPFLNVLALQLPVDGERLITQGFDGKITHRGAWKYALDFEARHNGQMWIHDGATVENFVTWDTPVLSPCDGVVVRALHEVRDNEAGGNNPDTNWGNFVLILADNGAYVLLSHLKKDSLIVAEGMRVARGQLIGKCGNSGRSPVPHLHLHVQETARQGSPTRPFCLTKVLSRNPKSLGWRYHTAMVPDEGMTLRPTSFEPSLYNCFASWLPGEYRWRISTGETQSYEETLVMDFDETGCFKVRSRRHAAGFKAFIKDGEFFCVDFNGPGQSIAALLALGLSRVPCIQTPEGGVEWWDKTSGVPFAPAPTRWLHDTFDAFIGPTVIDYVFSFDSSKPGVVQCQLSGDPSRPNLPRSIQTTLAPMRLATYIEARFTDDLTMNAELVHYQPQAS